jgi:hypothetical protein
MKTVVLVVALAGACLATGCGKGPQDRTSATRESAPPKPAARPPDPAPAPAQTAARPGRDVCALLTTEELSQLAGVAIERVEKLSDGCAWYANAAAQQQKGMANVGEMFDKMTKKEPATAEENQPNMEAMLKGIIGAAGKGGPLLTVSVQSEGADQAEAMIKGTVAVVGGGMPGGKLEPIEGLGDRAYMGPAGSSLYVRKGTAWVQFDLRTFSGSREQALEVAKRLVSKL